MALDNTSSSERHTAFMSALVTEHFVLQTAASATVAEAASRTSLYVFSLSSSLVAMGFVSQFPQTFRLFAAAILPALFVLGLLTIVRLVASGIENLQFLRGIARIRGYYRTLTPEAAVYGCWARCPVFASRYSGVYASAGTGHEGSKRTPYSARVCRTSRRTRGVSRHLLSSPLRK